MKKLLALALAVIMVMSLAVTAFADDGDTPQTYSITVNHHSSTHKHIYDVYQIFTGRISNEGVLTDIVWGTGISAAGKSGLQEAYGIPATTPADDVAAEVATKISVEAKEATVLNLEKGVKFARLLAEHQNEWLGSVAGSAVGAENPDGSWGQYTVSGLEVGYYLIKDREGSPFAFDGTTTGQTDTETFYILRVTHGDQVVNPKASTPTLIKKVDDKNDSNYTESFNTIEKDSADYDIGDNVPFTITVTMPLTGMDLFESYKVVVHDTFSQALSYNNDMKVYVEKVDADHEVTSYFTTNESNHKMTSGCEDVKVIKKSDNDTPLEIVNGTDLIFKYTAQLTADGVKYGMEGNDNVAYLQFSNDPNSGAKGGTSNTPEDKVKVFTYFLNVNKVDGNGKPLAGADFALYKLNRDSGDSNKYEAVPLTTTLKGVQKHLTYTTVVGEKTYTVELLTDGADTSVVKVTDDTGAKVENYQELKIDIDANLATGFFYYGLDDGEYKLEETKVPDGHNSIDPILFTVSANHDLDSDNPGLTTLAVEGPMAGAYKDGSITGSVVNVAGSVLPSTGGMGTTLFYILGSVMTIGAAVVLITKKRMA